MLYLEYSALLCCQTALSDGELKPLSMLSSNPPNSFDKTIILSCKKKKIGTDLCEIM